jgi:hypothetical protein
VASAGQRGRQARSQGADSSSLERKVQVFYQALQVSSLSPVVCWTGAGQDRRRNTFPVSDFVPGMPTQSRGHGTELPRRRDAWQPRGLSYWLILQNETCTIGLFQGLFEKNTSRFNPGWDRACNTLADVDDVRDIQKSHEHQGLTLLTQAEESSTGPASLVLLDPDGNPILIDQHVPGPRS